MRLVIALGGNALLQRDQTLSASAQRKNAALAAAQIAPLAQDHQLLISHGNGPQVGLLALQAAAYTDHPEDWPLDVLGSESAGMIGYILEQELRNTMTNPSIVTLLTQIEVKADDPAFSHPTKPIGPYYDDAQATSLQQKHDWSFVETPHGMRRVVPSPIPDEILGIEEIRQLVSLGATVICTGGGGIPVIRDEQRRLQGCEAVIDKDLSSALLAVQTQADALIMLTNVDAVYQDWGTPQARPLTQITPGSFDLQTVPEGSMRPKIDAGLRFVRKGGRFAAIGALGQLQDILRGDAGTRIVSRAA